MTQTKKRILFYLIPLFLLLIAIPMTANAAAQERREPLVVWEAAPADNEGWTWDVQRATEEILEERLKLKEPNYNNFILVENPQNLNVFVR